MTCKQNILKIINNMSKQKHVKNGQNICLYTYPKGVYRRQISRLKDAHYHKPLGKY